MIQSFDMRLTEAIDIFSDNLEDIALAMTQNLADDVRGMEVLGTSWVAEEVRKLTIEHRYGERIRRLKFINRHLHELKSPQQHGKITETMILRAKDYPIQELYTGKLRKSGKSHIGICPFHNEKTGSFHIKDNRFNCFGCDAHGDNIDFYMKQHGCTFTSAVKKLQ